MPSPRLPLEELHRLIPGLEELEGLRQAVMSAAVPDPDREWERTRAFTTVDKRVAGLPELNAALQEAEARLHGYVAELFGAFPALFEAYFEGRHDRAAQCLVELGERQESLGRSASARRCYESALRLSAPLPDKRVQILALRRVGRVSLALGDLQDALLHYHRSIELARAVDDVRAEVIAQTGYGNVLLFQGRWAETEACYRAALARAATAPDPDLLRLERAQLQNNLGMILTHLGRAPEAEEWFAEALAAWAVLDSPEDLAICLHNRGLLHVEQGRFAEAERTYHQALDLQISPALRSIIAIDLAECLLREQRIDEAEQWGRSAEEQAIAARSPYHLGHMYRGLGNIARARGAPDGFVFFEKALEIARERGYRPLEGETLLDYALLRRQTEEWEEAQCFVERACGIYSELGIVHEQARAEELLRTLAAPLPPSS